MDIRRSASGGELEEAEDGAVGSGGGGELVDPVQLDLGGLGGHGGELGILEEGDAGGGLRVLLVAGVEDESGVEGEDARGGPADDEFFTKEYSNLDQRASDWKQYLPGEGLSADQINKYFDDLHADFVSLRDHISNY